MLKLYPAHLSKTGLSYYEDDTNPAVFYVMPDQPSIRQDANGKYVFKFIEYLMPVDRPDGSKGGGFLIFDSVFVIPPDKMNALQAELDDLVHSIAKTQQPVGAETQADQVAHQINTLANQVGDTTLPAPPLPTTGVRVTSSTKAQISMPSFLKGTAFLQLLDSGGALVTKIESAGKPSLLGSMTCSFTAELSPEGAAVVKGAMQGSGGIIQIGYDLTYNAALPPITGKVWFNAEKFAQFHQQIDKSGGAWYHGNDTEKETLREQFLSSDSGGVFFDFSHLNMADPAVVKIQTDLTNWGWQQLNVATQNVLGASSQGSAPSTPQDASGDSSTPQNPGVTGQNTGADLGQNRGDDGMDHVTRDESSLSAFSFEEDYNEKDGIAYETVQQGTLPNIPHFNEYAVTLSADDPFFAQIHATLHVNADFQKFMIQSVDVSAVYDKINPPRIVAMHFTKPDDVLKFDSNTLVTDKTKNYTYTATVNYLDQSAPYVCPPQTTNSLSPTVDVGTMGVFYLDIMVSNVDFKAVPQVVVSVKYPDTDPTGAPVSRTFSFDVNNREASMVVVLLKQVTKTYQYQIIYMMADGSQLTCAWQQGSSQQLYIKNPFSPRLVSFLSEGDFTSEVDNIFLRMVYSDAANHYEQNSEFTFSANNRSHDWTFPVVTGGLGKITYSGVISYKNHTTENIPETVSASSLITFGPANQSIVTVSPDPAMLDFTKVKLVQINFSYADPANNISSQQEVVVKPTSITPGSWTFYAKDPTKLAYTYQATFYLATTPPSVVKQPPATSTDTDLILMMPS